MKLGKKSGCVFDDRIDLELSPSDVESLYHHFKGQAENSREYSEQRWFHKMVEYFEQRHLDWRRARDEKDKS